MPVKRRKLQLNTPAAVPAVEPLNVIPFPDQRLLALPQAATYLACSVWFIRDLLRRNLLRKIKQGKKFVIDRADLNSYIERAKAA